MWGLLGILAVSVVHWFQGRSGRPKPATPVDLAHDLDVAESLILEGHFPESAEYLNRIGPAVDAIQGKDGCGLRAWHRLACAEHIARGGDRGKVRQLLEDALKEIEGMVEGPTRVGLEIRALASLGFLVAPDDTDRVHLEHGEAAIARACETERPDAILQVVWLACRFGDLYRLRGEWNRAKEYFEIGIRTAERLARPTVDGEGVGWSGRARELFWSHAHASASGAARELGEVAWSLGEREAGILWIDRAIALLEGAELPVARLAQAQALLARGMLDAPDAMGDIAPRLAVLERAIVVGLATPLPAARAVVADAETAIGTMFSSMGSHDQAVTRLRRVQDHLRDVREAASWTHPTHASLLLGFALRDAGESDAALGALRAALESGRHSTHPEARQLAAVAAHHIHGMQLEQDPPDQARATLEALENLVPTLNPEVRATYWGLTSRSRAHQQRREGRSEEARLTLERAETVARDSSGATAWSVIRAIVMDLGALSLAAGNPEEAVEHFRRALALPSGPRPTGEEQAGRAELHWKLSQALLELDRRSEAETQLERAHLLGRDSGCAEGREIAALAAMMQGDLNDNGPRERRGLYESAARLARLSRRPRGIQISEALSARLREFAE